MHNFNIKNLYIDKLDEIINKYNSYHKTLLLLLLLLLLLKMKYLMLVILSKKTDYNTKISGIENKITTDQDHDKYITTQEFNNLTAENVSARLVQANLAIKNDIANFAKGRVLIIN